MSEHTHTPGPWRVDRRPDGMVAEIHSQTGCVMTSIYVVTDATPPPTTANAEADAVLIAAAPTMLDALRNVRAALESAQNELAQHDGDTDVRRAVALAETLATSAILAAVPSVQAAASERVKTKRAARVRKEAAPHDLFGEPQTPVSGSAAIPYRRPAGGELFTTEGL